MPDQYAIAKIDGLYNLSDKDFEEVSGVAEETLNGG